MLHIYLTCAVRQRSANIFSIAWVEVICLCHAIKYNPFLVVEIFCFFFFPSCAYLVDFVLVSECLDVNMSL